MKNTFAPVIAEQFPLILLHIPQHCGHKRLLGHHRECILDLVTVAANITPAQDVTAAASALPPTKTIAGEYTSKCGDWSGFAPGIAASRTRSTLQPGPFARSRGKRARLCGRCAGVAGWSLLCRETRHFRGWSTPRGVLALNCDGRCRFVLPTRWILRRLVARRLVARAAPHVVSWLVRRDAHRLLPVSYRRAFAHLAVLPSRPVMTQPRRHPWPTSHTVLSPLPMSSTPTAAHAQSAAGWSLTVTTQPGGEHR